jgi:phosphate transport system protein
MATKQTSGDHIVKSYDEELEQLNNDIIKMGGLTEAQIARAIESVVKRDPDLASRVIADDELVDELNYEIDIQTTRLLALRQPMALDLRHIVAALKISSDLERIADYAANISKRAITLSSAAPVAPVHSIPRMSRQAQQMVKDVLDAYIARDVNKAIAVWQSDESLDRMYTSLFREALTYMIEDPRSISICTHLLFIAKNIERIGDHVTNIAETIYFLVHGNRMRATRPKGSGEVESLSLSLGGGGGEGDKSGS